MMNRAKLSQTIGFSGLYVFSASAWVYTPGVDIGLVLMLIASLIHPVLYPMLWKHWLIKFLAFWAVFLMASSLLASLEFPDTQSPQLTALYRWSKLLLFFLPAWWFSLDEKALKHAFIASLSGLLLMIGYHLNWVDFLHFRMAERLGFGLADPNETAMACSVYLLALPLFCSRCSLRDIQAWVGLMAGVLAFSMLLYAFLSTLSRQAWLALAIVAPLMLSIQYAVYFKKNAGFKNLSLVLALLMILSVLAGLVYQQRDFLLSRVVAEKIELSSMSDQSAPSSVGIRLNMLKFGLEKWLERPIIGWGIGSSGHVMRESQDKRLWIGDENLGNHGYYLHLHSVYAEMLLRVGLIGALGWLSIFGAVLHIAYCAYRLGRMPPDVFLFWTGSAMMMLIIGVFGFYVGNNRGCAYWLLLAGGIYSHRLKQERV